jgi:hypothetical protein
MTALGVAVRGQTRSGLAHLAKGIDHEGEGYFGHAQKIARERRQGNALILQGAPGQE